MDIIFSKVGHTLFMSFISFNAASLASNQLSQRTLMQSLQTSISRPNPHTDDVRLQIILTVPLQNDLKSQIYVKRNISCHPSFPVFGKLASTLSVKVGFINRTGTQRNCSKPVSQLHNLWYSDKFPKNVSGEKGCFIYFLIKELII